MHPDGPALSTDPTFLVLRLLSLISLSSSVGRRLVLSSCREAIGLENRSAHGVLTCRHRLSAHQPVFSRLSKVKSR